jgi:hypothetical protein
MVVVAAIDSGPSVTDWIQTGATIVGIFAAARVAIGVSKHEHRRQVMHQVRQDVAKAVNTIHRLYPAFETGEMIEAFGDSPETASDASQVAADRQSLHDAAQLLRSGSAELRNVTNVLRLTAPSAVYGAAKALLNSVDAFHNGVARVQLFESLKEGGSTRTRPDVHFTDMHDKIKTFEAELVRVSTDGLRGKRPFFRRFLPGK